MPKPPKREIGPFLPAARAGSRSALGQMLEASRHYLLWVARREMDPALQTKGGASDLVQETFLEAHRDFGRFQGETEADFLAWLRRLLLNNLYNFSRRYRETGKRSLEHEVSLNHAQGDESKPTELAAATDSPCEAAMDQELAAVVQAALERLPPDYRQVIALWQEEGRTFQDIGAQMQRSANAARMLWVRAIQHLQEELDALDHTE